MNTEQLVDRFDDAVSALQGIADDLHRIADSLEKLEQRRVLNEQATSA